MSESGSGPDLLDQLANEFAERFRRGERPALTEYTNKFPELANQIRDLFPALVVMEELGSVGGQATGPFSQPTRDGTIPQQLGEYRILREVARGGMGIVYEAVQESLGRHVALKVLPYQKHLHGNQLERFRREARAAANLHHTNIVPVFGIGEHEGVHYYAMQFIQGQALDSVLRELKKLRETKVRSEKMGAPELEATQPDNKVPLSLCIAQGLYSGQFGSFPVALLVRDSATPTRDKSSPAISLAPESPKETIAAPDHSTAKNQSHSTELSAQPEQQYFRSVAQVGVQVAEALAYAHQLGILHRDIKPGNLLLDTQGAVWVTDFGLAKAEGSDELTNPGDIVGTLRYMAPERFNGISDPRSDVYSLGLTLYEMIILKPAFVESDRGRLIKQITTESPPPLGKFNTQIPRDLCTIIHKAIAQEPERRYQTAEDLAEDLRRFVADQPILARRVSWTEHVWRWCKRNKAVASLGAIVTILAVVITVGAVLISMLQEERDRAESNQIRAEKAQDEANINLKRALEAEKENKIREHLALATAIRRSGKMGQRFQALEELKKALALKPPAEFLAMIRNEAISCLALPDIRVAKEWDGWLDGSAGIFFDDALNHYARTDQQGMVFVYRVADGKEIYKLKAFGPGLCSPQLSPDGKYLVVGGAKGHLKLWKLNGQNPSLLFDQEGASSTSRFSPDGQELVICKSDGLITLFELASGKKRSIGNGSPAPNVAAFHPKGKQLAVASRTTTEVWDLEKRTIVAKFPHPNEYYAGASWHPSGDFLATIGGDRVITLWELATQKPVSRMVGCKSGGVGFNFNPTGDILVSTGWEGMIRFWDPWTGKQLFSNSNYLLQIKFNPDGHMLAVEVLTSKVRLLEVALGREYRTLAIAPTFEKKPGNIIAPTFDRKMEDVNYFDISPDGQFAAVSNPGGNYLWDLNSGRQLALLTYPNTRYCVFEPSGSLLTNNAFGLFRWPFRKDKGKSESIRIGPPEKLPLSTISNQIVCSKDGKIIANASHSFASAIDLSQAGKVIQFGPTHDARFVAISPDNRYLATGNHHGGGATVWNLKTGAKIKDLPVGGNCNVTFSPDGKWLATSGGNICRLWRVDTWEAGPQIGPDLPCFSPDGKILAVETRQGVIRLVDPNTGKEFASLEDPHHDRAHVIRFTLDGSKLASLAIDSASVHVWDLRAIREHLKELGLDWNLPPYPPVQRNNQPPPTLKVQVEPGRVTNPFGK